MSQSTLMSSKKLIFKPSNTSSLLNLNHHLDLDSSEKEHAKTVNLNLTNTEKEEIKMLDKWFNDFQYQTQSKFDETIEKNIKQFKKKNKEIKENEMKVGPYLNQSIINNCLYDRQYFDQEKQKLEGNLSKRSEDLPVNINKKSGHIQKNLQTIRCENNEKAIRQIIIKKIRDVYTKTKDVNYIMSKGNVLSQDAFNSFKTLKNDFGENLQINSSRKQEILEKLKLLSEKPSKHFDFDKDEKILDKFAFNFKVREKFLWDGYTEIDSEISRKKNFVNDLRKFISDLSAKKKRSLEDMDIIMKKFERLEEKYLKLQPIASPKPQGKRESVAKNANQFNNISNLIKINKVRDEKEHQRQIIDDQITKITKDLKEQTMKLEEITSKIKELRVKKMNIRLQLKDLYTESMKKESERGQTFVPIMKSLKKLNFSPSEENFPKYLDSISKDYLFKVCDIELEIEELSKLHSHLLNNNMNLDRKSSSLHLMSNLSHHVYATEVSKRVEELKNEYVNSKYMIENAGKVSFEHTSSWSFLKKIKKIHAKKQDTDSIKDFKYRSEGSSDEVSEKKKKIIVDCKNIVEKIQHLNLIKEKLKLAEINRLLILSINDEKQEENLEKKLRVLFGKNESETILEVFKKEKTLISQKIKSNQTYNFSSNINSYKFSTSGSKQKRKYHELPQNILLNYQTLKENVTNSNSFYLKNSYLVLNKNNKNNGNDSSKNITEKPLKNGFFSIFANNNNNTFHFTNQ